MATGENWNMLMLECAKQSSIIFECADDPSYDDLVAMNFVTNGCGQSFAAHLYFISYMVIVS